jgi:hypothetical protein
MRHAVIDNNIVVNIIEIDPRNASDFGNAITIPDGLGVGIGDTYREGHFYRYNEETQQEEEILPYDPMAEMQKNMDEMVSASVSQSLTASPMMLGVGDLFQAMSPTLQTNLPESAGLFASAYRVWAAGEEFAQWELITHKDIAYQVQQKTTAQEHQPPDSEGMLAVYVPYVVAGADGVKPWAYGMHVHTGDLVRKDGVVWEAKKDMIPCVWEPTEGNEWKLRSDLS